MGEMIKLNLGCGLTYRPGYVNVDLSDRSVADVSADVGDMPYAPNTVETIEAIQLIEHFDLVHSKYVLAEWFRVLKPGGTLVLETPDLKAALKRVSSSKRDDRAAAVQWLFGIDSRGLLHKGGFTFELIEEVLADIGYEDVRKKPAKTHTYADGMRVECRKPERPGLAQFLASLRKHMKVSLGIDDSFLLIPLEACISKLKMEIDGKQHLKKEEARSVASLAAVWHPSIAISLLEICVEEGLISEAEIGTEIAVCRHLLDLRFHERVFTLWTKSRKANSRSDEFQLFVNRVRNAVSEAMEHPDTCDQLLHYVLSIDPTPIEFLDSCLIEQRAKASLNTGILRFHRGDLKGAEEFFSESLRMDPTSMLAHWNMARVGAAIGRSDELILFHYSESKSLILEPRLRSQIEKEMNSVRSDRKERGAVLPVSEYDLLI